MLSHYVNRWRSCHRLLSATTQSSCPLHGHRLASARNSKHRTSYTAKKLNPYLLPVLCLLEATAASTLIYVEMPLLKPPVYHTLFRDQALYLTPARTPISLSFSIRALHIMGCWNTQWDLTSSALPAGYATAPCRTFQTDATPHTYRPSQSSRPVDACTDTNQPQLLHPCTTHRGPLEYAVGSHLECSACRIRDSHCGAPNTHVVLSHSGCPACLPRRNAPTLSWRFYPTLRLL